MCGRIVLFRLARFTDLFPWIRALDGANLDVPRYNIAPTQPIAAVLNDGTRVARPLHWGLVPHWAKDVAIGSKMINARLETLAEKPSFAKPLRRRRCLIPADGFYEWRRDGEGPRAPKTPMFIHPAEDARPFAFAGLWERWQSPDGTELHSCTVITRAPNALMASIHDRMPAILDERHYESWLDPDERTPESLMPLLDAYPAERMAAHAVGRDVNRPGNDGPALIEPARHLPPTPAAALAPAAPRATRGKASPKVVTPDPPGLFD
jgi:putative SOS response-associated peptidase YedK